MSDTDDREREEQPMPGDAAEVLPPEADSLGDRRERPLWPGVLAWTGVCAVYLGLEYADLVDGLALPVPLIAALVAARALDRRRSLRRVCRVLVYGLSIPVVLAAVAVVGHARVPIGMLFATPTITVAVAIGLTAMILDLVPALRRAVFRPLGLDPDSAVHSIVVVAAVGTIALSVALFAELQGQPEEKVPFYLTDSLVSVLSDGALAVAGIGFLLTRGLRDALVRLDLRPLRLPHLLIAAGIAALFLGVVGVLEHVESVWLPTIHALEDRFDYEFVGMSPLVGAVLLSVAAGIGEELVFRGALQPRLGVIATSVLFASVHVQYQIPGMVMIFVVALGLGIVKERTSTTFTTCVHVIYDMGAFFLP